MFKFWLFIKLLLLTGVSGFIIFLLKSFHLNEGDYIEINEHKVFLWIKLLFLS